MTLVLLCELACSAIRNNFGDSHCICGLIKKWFQMSYVLVQALLPTMFFVWWVFAVFVALL